MTRKPKIKIRIPKRYGLAERGALGKTPTRGVTAKLKELKVLDHFFVQLRGGSISTLQSRISTTILMYKKNSPRRVCRQFTTRIDRRSGVEGVRVFRAS